MNDPKELAVAREEPQVLDIQALAKQALAQGDGSVENLAAILALSERVEDRAKDAERKSAIAAARRDFTPVLKDKVGNPKHATVTYEGKAKRGGYAGLEDIQAMVDPVFANHGLSYRWDYETRDGKDWLVFIVEHENGTEEKRSRTLYQPDEGHGKNQLQARGSGESYAMRYTMKMGLSIRGVDPDDDAQSAEHQVTSREPLPDDLKSKIVSGLDAIEDDKLREETTRRMLAFAGAEDIGEIPKGKAAEIITRLAKMHA